MKSLQWQKECGDQMEFTDALKIIKTKMMKLQESEDKVLDFNPNADTSRLNIFVSRPKMSRSLKLAMEKLHAI